MYFVFLILDFNIFYFYRGSPWKPRIYVTGTSSLKIVFIFIIIIISFLFLYMNAKIKRNNQALKKGLCTRSFNSIFSISNGIWKFSLVFWKIALSGLRLLKLVFSF